MDAVKSGKISTAVLDVYENEEVYKGKIFENSSIPDELVEEIISNDNIFLTSHTAFYTVEALQDIISTVLENLHEFEKTGNCINNTAGMR